MVDDWLSNVYEGMSRRQFLAMMGAAGVTLAGFAIAAKPVAGEVITTPADGLHAADGMVTSGDFRIPIYEARPAKEGKYPVVVVIPEIFGMHEHIRDVVRRFAKEGFLAVTFEPYAREGGVAHLADIAAVRKVVDPVPDSRVMGDLDAVLSHIKGHQAAEPARIGVTGFCRGGLYALLYAAHNPEVRAAIPWYGQIKPAKTPGIRTAGPLEVAHRIRCPVLGLYGEADQGIPSDDVREMERTLKAAGTVAEFVLYPGAPHAFYADYRPSYREAAARDAWHQCIGWLAKYLKG